jgi:hypothetical protein
MRGEKSGERLLSLDGIDPVVADGGNASGAKLTWPPDERA